MKAAIILALAVAACGDPVDATAHPPIEQKTYVQWMTPIETYGVLPGHGGETFRRIYANPIAQTYEGGQYPSGPDDATTSIIVKEVYDLGGTSDAPAPGALQYVALMRRIGPPPQGLSDEGGWLFSYTTTLGGSEEHASYCWSACHVDAPYHGAWLDYSK